MKLKSLTVNIFFSTFLVGVMVYFLCAILFISNMYSYFENQIFEELKIQSAMLEGYVEASMIERIKQIETKNRITLIKDDGTVYFDNTVDFTNLKNHSTRREFIKAKENGDISISRYSDTMLEKTLYHARLLKNGDILRISCKQHSVVILILGMSQIFLVMLVIATIISGIIANILSKKIVEPLDKIDLNNPYESEVYEELKPFTHRIAEENFEKTQREELRQQFTANVSHELKTPLTSILGFAEILKNGGTDEHITKEFANTIYDESKKMIILINDIIKLSKLDEKSISLEKDELSLREVTGEVFSVIEPARKIKNLTLNLSGDSGQINGIRPVIYEMIYNLIDNAIKYNKQNGKIEVKIETNNSSKKVFFSVSDTGIGIPPSEQERVFERFYRVDKSRSKDSGGTGLGLSIVKHAAKYHNANIVLTGEEGKGCRFTVIFPL